MQIKITKPFFWLLKGTAFICVTNILYIILLGCFDLHNFLDQLSKFFVSMVIFGFILLLRQLSHSKLKGRLWDHICFVTHRESRIVTYFLLCLLSLRFFLPTQFL